LVELWLPYGKTEVVARIQSENLSIVIKTDENPGVEDPRAEIIRALDEPLKSEKIEETVKTKDKVAIVIDDHTRPSPSKLILPPLIEKINHAGIKDSNISIIIGSGSHRQTRLDEITDLVGEEIEKKIRIINHDCDAKDLVEVGETTRGTKVLLNKVFIEADYKILTGDVGFHYYAGYSGGRKSILPAIAGRSTIERNHAFLLDPQSRTGNLHENPVHLDMQEAAELVNVNFTVNVVLNSERKIVKAFSGDLNSVFMEGVKLVDEMYKIPIDNQADIVLTSAGGSPYDIDLYQAYKAVDNALDAMKKGGVIILVAECPEGYGNEVFYRWMRDYKTLKNVEKRLKSKFVLGAHKAYYLLKALEKAGIILVSTMPGYYEEGIFKLKKATSANLALEAAFKVTGRKSKVIVIPHGSSTLPVLKK